MSDVERRGSGEPDPDDEGPEDGGSGRGSEDEPDEDDLDGDEEADRDEDGPPSDRAAPSAGHPARGVRVAALAVLGAVVAVCALNAAINLQARQGVVDRCRSEQTRLRVAVEERSGGALPGTEWMVLLYQARRVYAAELCDRTMDELSWWRWNMGRAIEVDLSQATKQEISRALEAAAASCLEEVEGLRRALDEHVATGEPDAGFERRVREISSGQLQACVELRRAVAHSRLGFWPALSAESASATPAALVELMPAEPAADRSEELRPREEAPID